MNIEIKQEDQATRQAVCSTDLLCVKPEQKHRTVVRVKTTCWHDGKGMHFKKSLNVLKRKSFGMDILYEECSMAGAEECAGNIINFHDVVDGVYELIVCNVSKDWETGYVDDWELKLIPFDA